MPLTPDELGKEWARTKWMCLLFGVLLIFHVFDYAGAKLASWYLGVNLAEYHTPHLDAYKATIEPLIGMVALAGSAVAWSMEQREKHKKGPA